jgi:hypothetical protein
VLHEIVSPVVSQQVIGEWHYLHWRLFRSCFTVPDLTQFNGTMTDGPKELPPGVRHFANEAELKILVPALRSYHRLVERSMAGEVLHVIGPTLPSFSRQFQRFAELDLAPWEPGQKAYKLSVSLRSDR